MESLDQEPLQRGALLDKRERERGTQQALRTKVMTSYKSAVTFRMLLPLRSTRVAWFSLVQYKKKEQGHPTFFFGVFCLDHPTSRTEKVFC